MLIQLENVIQQEIEGLALERPTKTPPVKGVPTLPEPTMPPPPPPTTNGTLTKPQPVTKPNLVNHIKDEPIYDAIVPRQEELHPVPDISDPMSTSLIQENGLSGTGHKLRPKSPAVVNVARSASPVQRSSGGPMSPSSPKHSRPSSRASSTGTGHPYAEREQRRKHRVEKKLQEMQQVDVSEKDALRDDVYYDILEFAENYFNSHERSPEGTIMATLTRKGKKSPDMVPKYEMITYYRGSTIPSSHIHMYDPENVVVACNIFRVSNSFGFNKVLSITSDQFK